MNVKTGDVAYVTETLMGTAYCGDHTEPAMLCKSGTVVIIAGFDVKASWRHRKVMWRVEAPRQHVLTSFGMLEFGINAIGDRVLRRIKPGDDKALQIRAPIDRKVPA